jgi:membrane protein involved in colicin uptake
MKQIDDNMTGWKNRIEMEQKTIESLPEFAFEAMEIYKTTLDMAKAIAEGQRLADIQKRKKEAEAAAEKMRAEAEARRKEEEARKAAEHAGADMAEGYAAGVKEQPYGMAGAWIKFEAYLTIPQAQALREFFIKNGIEFRAV